PANRSGLPPPLFRSGERSKLIGACKFRPHQLRARREAEHRLHPRRRPRLCRRELLRPARLYDAEHRSRAAEGLRITQSYSNSANCSPTRTALITGRYQMRLQVGLEEPINSGTPKTIGLPPSHPTLPSLLRTAGYGTSLVGKWHLGFLPDYSPLKSGYDRFFGFSAAPPISDNGGERFSNIW